MKKFYLIFLIFIIVTNIVSENRYALIIGNSDYDSNIGALNNPINDANDISNTLLKTNFDVTKVINGNKKELIQSVRSFVNKVSAGDTVLFYYSGHGVQVNGQNYIIPIGADLVYESDVEFEAVEMDYILSSLEKSGSNTNIIIFDACRNNELKKDNKSITKGLAITQRRLPESIIIYSTSPGEVAMDGKGRNSPFAQSLIDNLTVPNQSLNTLIMNITTEVKTKTGFQTPWRSSNLTKDFYFIRETTRNRVIESSDNDVTYGSLLITCEVDGDFYLNDKKFKTFEKGKSYKISNLAIGTYQVTYKSDNHIDEDEVFISQNKTTSITFKGKKNNLSTDLIPMILIEAGRFKMGSNLGNSNENPVHDVTITRGFYIGTFEVTQKQWNKIMESQPSFFLGLDRPVTNISWYDVIEFCNKLSVKEGYTPVYIGRGKNIMMDIEADGYRLPTEAEWEYVANGGVLSQKFKYSGSNFADHVAISRENSFVLGRSHENYGTQNIGSKKPNELGIFDMSGNVYEWCWDWYSEYNSWYQEDPLGGSGSKRVLRGGSWYHDDDKTRTTSRFYQKPTAKSNYVGFRLVRTKR